MSQQNSKDFESLLKSLSELHTINLSHNGISSTCIPKSFSANNSDLKSIDRPKTH